MGVVRPALIDFQVIPATEDDCLTLAQVEAIAFDNSKKEPPGSNTFQIMFGSYSDVGNDFRRGNFLEKMRTDPTAHFWKAVIRTRMDKRKSLAGPVGIISPSLRL